MAQCGMELGDSLPLFSAYREPSEEEYLCRQAVHSNSGYSRIGYSAACRGPAHHARNHVLHGTAWGKHRSAEQTAASEMGILLSCAI
jgi:hypothetical protein